MANFDGPQIRTNNSISLPQKEFQKVKKIMEKHILNAGGSFDDKNGQKGVRSTYTLDKITEKYVWHRTFSAGSSLLHAKKDILDLFLSLGVVEKMGLEAQSKSALRKKFGLRKSLGGKHLDGRLRFPPAFRNLEKALDELLSKTPAEYEADMLNEDTELDRMIRYYW